jgi:hypothetical protein
MNPTQKLRPKNKEEAIAYLVDLKLINTGTRESQIKDGISIEICVEEELLIRKLEEKIYSTTNNIHFKDLIRSYWAEVEIIMSQIY